jgi:hypothetical protein
MVTNFCQCARVSICFVQSAKDRSIIGLDVSVSGVNRVVHSSDKQEHNRRLLQFG